ncbi:hypothetical protein ABID23_001084 [Bartonella silvatica]|uniref:Uncharacterized protein n=1 Tax=Bartonella silvatica TaxID=357760 RepID=A0ABV2HHG2_9HYPH
MNDTDAVNVAQLKALQGKNDTLSWDQNFHAFSAMRKGEHSKIAFLAPGIISSKSSEAINSAQIYSLRNEIMSYFGRESGYDQNGNWRAAFFKVKVFKDDGFEDKRTYTDVASAFDAVNDAFTGFENKINKKFMKPSLI